ncbi:efflux RND transporter permease subunit [Desulfosporosinus meridiei]|uniref:Cation/multidrug efflux pump n=1 Tax=Desulfosporosinus meridiei (strain ATCC BAA-275 / DSM 13257 / KCTC 12902 / NCIMB 13706 / S10) TaxID=768704 RepID=J7IP25_DESMD|nr:efflux RND transporter permease subunit [Desulfosporosinus meridiei]AFQ43340.1 cation/multidrug efflux pump [Desulfosporosinus meridiei DSM 13257]
MFITNISIKRPVFITVIIIVFLVVGMLCFRGLSINDMPQADFPYVTVAIEQHGVAPDQMETNVAKKVEEAIGQISGVKHIYTNISEGVCNVIVEFDLAKSPDVAAQEVRDKVSSIRKSLPNDIEEPIIAKYDFTATPILSLAVSGTMDNRVISKIVDDVITKSLYTVSGVGSVKVYGKEEREIKIKLDLEKLAEYGLAPAEMVSAVQNGNMERPGGKVNDGQTEISLRTDNKVKNLEDFYNITVGVRSGREIKVRDVATVADGIKDMDSISYYDGKEAIGVDIIKQSGSNTVLVSDNVKKQLDFIKGTLPKGITVDVVADNSVSIRDSVDEVVKTILEGCILAIIIVFIFLREWESTLISGISLPTSIVTTFIAMKVMDFSLNTMSLMALSLAVGLLIDDAIVVIENIVRHLHMSKPPMQAAREATSEIGLAVMATTFAVVAVFVPIAMVSGIIGKYFVEFGLTVAFSMLVSLFISFTLVPMMSSRLLKAERKMKKTFVGHFLDWFNDKFDLLGTSYSKFLKVVLNHRLVTLIFTIGIFVASMKLLPLLGFSFIPATDAGGINISVSTDSGLTLQAVGDKAKEIEEKLKKYPEVTHVYTTVSSDKISIYAKLTEKQEREKAAKQIASEVREDLKGITGIELAVKASSLGPNEGKDVSFVILGNNTEAMQALALKGKKMLSQDPHAKDVELDLKTGKTETKLEVDRDKVSDLGVNVSLAATTIQALFDGIDAGKFEWAGDRYNVRVSLKDDQRKSLDNLNGIYVNGSVNGLNNQMIPLANITKKVLSTSYSTIHRYDRLTQIELSANVEGIPTGDFLNMYTNKLTNELDIPDGVFVKVGGMNEMMQEGFASLVTALLMGILFMFLVMAMQFESFLDPVAIMFSLPMALIGAVLGLYVAGSELSILSLIGIILLMGLVAKNGILLIDFTKQKMNEGFEVREALIEAGSVRLRPILMTTLAMIFGMIPVAIGSGSGAEMRAPMGHAVIGGLITSTLLTLFVVPVVYSLLDNIKKKLSRKSKNTVSTYQTNTEIYR